MIQQQCDTCGRWLDKNISNFKKYSKKTNGLNFHITCRECEEKQQLDKEYKDGKLLCHICGEYKDIDQFSFAGSNKYIIRQNRDCRCNQCKTRQRKKVESEYSAQEKLMSVLQKRWLGAKDRAQKKNIPFTITKEDLYNLWISQEGKCAISNLQMTYELNEGRIYTNISIDQIQPQLGYTKDNIQLVCMAVNQLKSDFSMQEVLTVCNAVVNNLAKWNK